MVIHNHPRLSIRRQCWMLNLNRSSYYQVSQGESAENLQIMKRIDEIYLQHPYYGSRRMQYVLAKDGICVGRHRIRRLMRLIGLQAIYQQPRTSINNPDHKIYPYLLRDLTLERSNEVWCSDRYYLCAYETRLYVSHRYYGLVFKEGLVLAIIQYS